MNDATLPILPQHHASIGARGSDGAAGAAGAAGATGAPGASGSLTLVQRSFSNAELHTLDTPTAINLTAAQPGFLQLIVAAGFEINKTHLTGAGAVPSWNLRYVGTATIQSLGAMDLGNTRNFGSWQEQVAVTVNSGGVGVVPPIAGVGLETIWSATYLPSTFSTPSPGALLSVIVASIPLRF